MGNNYKFSQIYIDTKQKEILGTDIKAFLNDDAFKIHKDNKPRIFANTIQINDEFGKFKKAILLYVTTGKKINVLLGQYRLLNFFMIKKKTVYYDNAVVKVYDVPIFIFQNFLILIQLLIEERDYWFPLFKFKKSWICTNSAIFLGFRS